MEQPSQLHKELIEKMAAHDWHYDYSDDIRAYTGGVLERQAILKLFIKLSRHEREYFLAAVPESVRDVFKAQVLRELADKLSE